MRWKSLDPDAQAAKMPDPDPEWNQYPWIRNSPPAPQSLECRGSSHRCLSKSADSPGPDPTCVSNQ